MSIRKILTIVSLITIFCTGCNYKNTSDSIDSTTSNSTEQSTYSTISNEGFITAMAGNSDYDISLREDDIMTNINILNRYESSGTTYFSVKNNTDGKYYMIRVQIDGNTLKYIKYSLED